MLTYILTMRFSEELKCNKDGSVFWIVSRVTQSKNNFHLKAWVKIGTSSIPEAGQGVFALRKFKKNSVVGCYVGKSYYPEQKNMLQKDGMYSLEVCAGAAIIDASTCGNFTAYINDQSRCSNCKFNENGEIKATRDIQVGEELFMSYGPQYWKGLCRRRRGSGFDNSCVSLPSKKIKKRRN